MIKLIVTDFDGTVLPFGEKNVSDKWKQAVNEALEQGITVAVSSGRTYRELLSFLPELEDRVWFICCDGAYTVKNGRVIYAKQIAFPDMERFLGRESSIRGCVLHGAFSDFCMGEIPASVAAHFQAKPIRSLHQIREPIFKITSFGGTEAPALPAGIRMHWDGGRDAMAQYVNRYADKGLSLSDLQIRLFLTKLQTACVGDSGNDIPMMHNAVISICIGNHSDELAGLCNAHLQNAEQSMELIRRVNEILENK